MTRLILLALSAALTVPLAAQAIIFSQNFDSVVAPALPAGWTVSGVGPGLDWVTRNTGADTPPNCTFTDDPAAVSDRYLDSPLIPLPGNTNTLTFRHNYITEATFDGGVLEIKVGAATTYTDIIVAGGTFTVGGYTGVISAAFASPIAGRSAWNGTSTGPYVTTTCTLPVAAQGQSVQLRWRMACDNSVAATGWAVDGVVITTAGPALLVAATAGTQQIVAANAQGTGNSGIPAGVFTIASSSAGISSLLSVVIKAGGTGVDQTDYSYVALFRDFNNNTTFEPATDVQIGVSATAFPSNDGTLTFNVAAAEQQYALAETRRYFIVVKLSGTALPGATFTYTVNNITADAATTPAGTPSAVMAGLRTFNPTLTVVAVAGTASNVYSSESGGGNGFLAGTFTIAGNNEGAPTMTAIQLGSAGTGDDSTAYLQVSIFREDGVTVGFQSAADILIASVVAFSADNGMANFPVPAAEQAVPPATTRTYYIVIKLNSTALPAQTFNYTVNDVTPAAGSSKAGVPSAAINGLVISTPNFIYTDASAAVPATAYLGSTGNVCQQFTLAYPGGPNDKPTSITVSGLGTANELNHLSGAQLWYDANTNGTFESASDTMIDNGAYSADNGAVVFDTNSMAPLQAGQTRTFFVAYDLNLLASHNQTFKCYVSAAAGMSLGGTNQGLPAPAVTGTPGLLVNATLLFATLNGPGLASTVDNDSVGTTGDGLVLCDVSIHAADGNPWSVGGLTFVASGTGAHDTAFSQLGLYEDTGNGVWDGSLNDGAAAGTLPAFGAGPGYAATFVLSNDLMAPGATRRFFLVGKLNGTAFSGQTFNARLTAITGTPPAGGVLVGFPTLDSTALVIDVPVLTVANGPNQPSPVLHKAGTALAYVMGKFRMGASNNNVTVSGITFTMTGSGNWGTSMETGTGVQVYLDDGDNFFNTATDTVLFQGNGAVSVNALFTASVIVPNSSTRDIWVRVNLLASAASSAPSPVTFSMTIANPGDVAANTMVMMGTPIPQGAILTVVNLTVTNFDPLVDLPAGGKPITITGTGFMAPFSATIGGLPCTGTPTVTPTQVTGLTVPAGTGSAKAIVITSGTLPPITLTETFSYNTGGSKAPKSSGDCTAGPAGPLMLPVMGILALFGLQRRRHT